MSSDASGVGVKTFHRGVLLGSLSVFALIVGFAATMPFTQARRDELGCGATCIGSMTSAGSALRLVGAVVIGRLSDEPTVGRRPMLALGLLGVGASLLLAGTVDSLRGLWLSLVPSSLLNQNASVLKALFADYAADAGLGEAEVASAMGQLGMALGASLMLGPVLASALASSYAESLRLAALATAVSAACVAAMPTPRARSVKSGAAAKPAGAEGGLLAGARRFLGLPVLQTGGARLLIAVRLCAGCAFHVYQVIWTPSLKARFDFGAGDYARFMGVIGFSYALSQGVVAKALIRRAQGNTVSLALACVVCLGVGRPLALWTLRIEVVYGAFVLMVMALGVLNTLISSACASLASGEQLGGLFGVLDSVENLAGIFGPLLGGQLARVGPAAPLAVVVGCYVINAALIACFYHEHVVLAPARAALAEKAGEKKAS